MILARNSQDRALRNLWLAVLVQCIYDSRSSEAAISGPAQSWLSDDSDDVGSLGFTCRVLDLEPEVIRKLAFGLHRLPSGIGSRSSRQKGTYPAHPPLHL